MINQDAIFAPVVAVVFLTFLVWLRMGYLRFLYIRSGVIRGDYMRIYQGADPPETFVATNRQFANLFEVPVLFYLAAVVHYTTGSVDTLLVVLGWMFVAARVAQSAVHLTYNRPAHRGLAYTIGSSFVWVIWARLLIRYAWPV